MALLNVRSGKLAEALAQINQGEDEERIAAAVARFNEATGEDENVDRNTIGALLREANRGELLVRIPVYTGPEGGLTSNVASVPLLEDGTLPKPQFHMNYISTEGTIIIEHRDVSSLNAIRRRVNEDVRKDHNGYAPQLTTPISRTSASSRCCCTDTSFPPVTGGLCTCRAGSSSCRTSG